jgi:streptogramin lyase
MILTATPTRQLLSAAAALWLAATLTGCGGLGVSSISTTTTGAAVHGISGRVTGGQQPVNGSAVQVYLVNNSALKGLSTVPAGASATTDSNGNFSITTSYSCPTGSYAYIVATGGNSGGGGSNSVTAMMAGLGPCPVTSALVNIDEVTTVASVYALAPFMADYKHIGYTGSTTGIGNAFAMINNLVYTPYGISPGLSVPANATIPSAEINTLADLLGNCINSTLTTNTCSTLLSLATPPSGGITATDTIGAMLNIATNPASPNVAALFGQVPTGSPFQPTLTVPPSDWTMSVKLTGNNLSTPYGVAIDSIGDAWVTNETGSAISLFGPTGSVLGMGGTPATFSGAQGISIDGSGNIWVANTGANNVLKLSSIGGLSATVSTGMAGPVDVAADARGNIWVANFNGNNLLEFNNSGVLQNTLTASSTLSRPTAVAIDFSGNAWISNSGAGTMAEYSKTATLVSTGSGWSDNALQGPAGVALDSAGRAWVAGTGGPELSGFTAAGTVAGSAPVYGVLNQPAGVAVDSAGTIWVANSNATGGLSQFAAATGTSVAASLGSLNTPVEVAVDPSGNLWTANSGDNSVSIFVGLAAATTTPLVARTQ